MMGKKCLSAWTQINAKFTMHNKKGIFNRKAEWIGKNVQNGQTEPEGYPKAYTDTPRGEVCL